jgi:hypothetical protein
LETKKSFDERAEARRAFKLMGLYYMGALLMIVGFIICFNAVFRTPSVTRPDSAAITTTREGAGY